MTSLVTWHRPEFEGREHELINQNGIAELAGVTRSAVSNWIIRNQSFPPVVVVQGTNNRAPRLYARTEVEAWIAERSRTPPPRARRAQTRPRREILTERTERAARKVAEAEQRMATLYAELGRAAEQLKHAQDEHKIVSAKLATLNTEQ